MHLSPCPPLKSVSRPQILVVEDEQIVAMDLKHRLTRLGYEVCDLVASGEEALDLLERRRPDLILMDIVLAGQITGTQAAKIVRERFQVPVVYLTAYSDSATLDQIRDTEGDGYLVKPFQISALQGVIELTLSRHKKEQQRREADRLVWEKASQEALMQLEQFTYTAGHDLQAPLRAATCLLDLFARRARPKLNEQEHEMLSQARAGLNRMDALLKDLVAYAQAGQTNGDSPQTTSTPVEESFRWACENLRDLVVESGAEITHDPLPTVIAGDTQLTELFQNLLSNAIKYRSPERSPRIHLGCERRQSETLFCLKDNGIGFDGSHAERIFEPFQRLHNTREFSGTGVGLAICKKIVERQGGRIWAESQPKRGATFFFTVPDRV